MNIKDGDDVQQYIKMKGNGIENVESSLASEFFDEYVEFMKKYQNSDNQASMLSDLADYMTKYSETMQKLDEIDEDSLSAADLAYYTEVNARIMKKLAEVS